MDGNSRRDRLEDSSYEGSEHAPSLSWGYRSTTTDDELELREQPVREPDSKPSVDTLGVSHPDNMILFAGLGDGIYSQTENHFKYPRTLSGLTTSDTNPEPFSMEFDGANDGDELSGTSRRYECAQCRMLFNSTSELRYYKTRTIRCREHTQDHTYQRQPQRVKRVLLYCVYQCLYPGCGRIFGLISYLKGHTADKHGICLYGRCENSPVLWAWCQPGAMIKHISKAHPIVALCDFGERWETADSRHLIDPHVEEIVANSCSKIAYTFERVSKLADSELTTTERVGYRLCTQKSGFNHHDRMKLEALQSDILNQMNPAALESNIHDDLKEQAPFLHVLEGVPKHPSQTRQDLLLLYLKEKYGLGLNMVKNIQGIPDQMKRIRTCLRIGPAAEPGHTSVVVGLEWPLHRFLQTQFVDFESRKQPFRSLITLTGSATDAQALTVGEYLSQTWPDIADKILQLLPASLEPHLGHISLRQASVTLDTSVQVYYEKDHILVRGVGNTEVITQVVQAFTWIACTARAGPAIKGVWECVPIFARTKAAMVRPGIQPFVVHFFTRSLPPTTQPGKCWQHMFQGAVLAAGFPIPQRATLGLGLEMPLNMVAELAGSRRLTEWDDKIFIKGYSTMLVAIKSVADVLVWHYYYAQPGKRVAYMDCTEQVESVDMARFGGFRHVVGWCSSSKYCAGSPDANYNIRGTQLPRPSAGLFLDKVSISTGSTIAGGAMLTPGTKERPPHLTRNGIIPNLRWLSKKYVVLWDEEAKRGWLVNGTSALLHIIRASLASYEKDDFSPCFMFDGSKMNNLPQNQYRHNTAIGVLIDQGNQRLRLYPNRTTEQTTLTDSGILTHTQTSSYFLFGDLVEQHLSALEKIVDFHSNLAGRDGVNLKMHLRKHLEGWEFADLTKEHDLRPRVATLGFLGYGWVDFVRAIGAITLFGRGFGELLQPTNSGAAAATAAGGLCERWSSLPTGNYNLAASVADLIDIMEQHGDAHAAPRELARGIAWRSPADTYAACPCTRPPSEQGRADCHVAPMQVLQPSSASRAAPGHVPPTDSEVESEPDGAVIFGYNVTFGYRWPERGTDEVPARDFRRQLRNMLPVRLFKQSQTEAEGESPGASDTDASSRPDSDETRMSREPSTDTTTEGEEGGDVVATLLEELPASSSLRSKLRQCIQTRRKRTLQDEDTGRKKRKVNDGKENVV
ncbi:Pfs domain [Cordyceps militaris]|uniref:Pfs domain n=1 Tax=Cordyceps militaris TaxID=73501 RepID=A0A2H4SUQ3_CORMI|nr:Pfs domain [Cordyceps militaris]